MLTDVEVKSELLKLIVQVDQILKTNGLQYSIMSGTLLGAVRHGGFIPWDDDIDIAMRRDDYERFLGLIRSGILEEFGLSATGYEINKDFWPFIKILNLKIRVEQEQEGQATQCDYLWIDVFPFDYLPEQNAEKILKKIAFQRKQLGYKIAQEKQFYKHKHGVKKVIYYLFSMFFKFISVDKIDEKIIALSKKSNNRTALIGDLTWGRSDLSKCIPENLFDTLVEYKFENVSVMGFKDYDKYLKQIYGEYMKLPPVNQRENHGIKAWRVAKDEK